MHANLGDNLYFNLYRKSGKFICVATEGCCLLQEKLFALTFLCHRVLGALVKKLFYIDNAVGSRSF